MHCVGLHCVILQCTVQKQKHKKTESFTLLLFLSVRSENFLTAVSQVRDRMYAEREVVTERLYNYSAFFLDVSHHLR